MCPALPDPFSSVCGSVLIPRPAASRSHMPVDWPGNRSPLHSGAVCLSSGQVLRASDSGFPCPARQCAAVPALRHNPLHSPIASSNLLPKYPLPCWRGFRQFPLPAFYMPAPVQKKSLLWQSGCQLRPAADSIHCADCQSARHSVPDKRKIFCRNHNPLLFLPVDCNRK